MKILFIDSNHSLLHKTLQEAGHVCDLNYDWSKEEILANIHLYDGLILRSKLKITKEFMMEIKVPIQVAWELLAQYLLYLMN